MHFFPYKISFIVQEAAEGIIENLPDLKVRGCGLYFILHCVELLVYQWEPANLEISSLLLCKMMGTLTLEERNQVPNREGRKIMMPRTSQCSPLCTSSDVQGKAIWLVKAVNYDHMIIVRGC